MTDSANSFEARDTLEVGDQSYQIYRLDAVPNTEKLPYSLKVLAENLLRNEDGANITKDHIEAIANWDPKAEPSIEIQYTPGPRRDAGLHRCAVHRRPGHHARGHRRPRRQRGQGQPARARRPGDRPLGDRRPVRHRRRIRAQRRDRVPAQRRALPIPALGPGRLPGLQGGARRAPASCTRSTSNTWPAWSWSATGWPTPTPASGTDSHTTMVNGLGVLGWGVGGIEAEAAMLGQPVSMLIPRVVGFKLTGEIQAGRHRHRRRADRHRDAAQARCGRQVRRVLRQGRAGGAAGQPRHAGQHEPRIRFHRSHFPDRRGDHRLPEVHRPHATSNWRWSRPTPKSRACGTTPTTSPTFSEYLELDLSTVVPSIAGPKRPQDRIALSDAKSTFREQILQTTSGDERRPAGLLEAGRGGRRDVPGQRSRRGCRTATPTTHEVHSVGRQRTPRAARATR